MRSRIICTAGGMAVNAKHRRDVEPAYHVRRDAVSEAPHLGQSNSPECPVCRPEDYAALHAKHRAEVSS